MQIMSCEEFSWKKKLDPKNELFQEWWYLINAIIFGMVEAYNALVLTQ